MEAFIAVSKSSVQFLNARDFSTIFTLSHNIPNGKEGKYSMVFTQKNDLIVSSYGPFIFAHHAFIDKPLFRVICGVSPTALCLSDDCVYLMAGDASGTITLWDLTTGELLRSVKAHFGQITAMIASKNRIISASDDGSINIYNLCDLADEGTVAASVNPVHVCNDHARPIKQLVICPSGQRFLSRSADKTIRLFDLLTGYCLSTFVFNAIPTSLAMSADETTLLVGLDGGRLIRIHSTGASGSMAANSSIYHSDDSSDDHSRKCSSNISGIIYSMDSSSFITVQDNGEVTAWDSHSFQPIRRFVFRSKVNEGINAVGALMVVPSESKVSRMAKLQPVKDLAKATTNSQNNRLPSLIKLDQDFPVVERTLSVQAGSESSAADAHALLERRISELTRISSAMFQSNEDTLKMLL